MNLNRRRLLQAGGASLLALAASPESLAGAFEEASAAKPQKSAAELRQDATRKQRMQWWHEARFGMFIHLGVYSALARKEWIMHEEGMPIEEYEKFVPQYRPAPGSPRTWARLAKQSGMKYMVLTSKHHEGFCNFNTSLTPYNAVRLGPQRDLVKEYVEAARAEGLRVGLYYSLMDWHHPDGQRCSTDPAARRRFVDYTHGLIREILTNYGKIDVLWYDIPWPLDRAGWESDRMNEMVFGLQPEIIVNDRNKMPGDFSTPEQYIGGAKDDRAWESCMTINESWGYDRADDSWKDSRTILRNLIACSAGGGNYLLNIGPQADGSVPAPSVRILREVGTWLDSNKDSIFETDQCKIEAPFYADFTQKAKMLYMHVHYWPGEYVAVGGLTCKVKSARLLKTGEPVKFEQDHIRAKFTGLPLEAPDWPITTIAIECDTIPSQDTELVERERSRKSV